MQVKALPAYRLIVDAELEELVVAALLDLDEIRDPDEGLCPRVALPHPEVVLNERSHGSFRSVVSRFRLLLSNRSAELGGARRHDGTMPPQFAKWADPRKVSTTCQLRKGPKSGQLRRKKAVHGQAVPKP